MNIFNIIRNINDSDDYALMCSHSIEYQSVYKAYMEVLRDLSNMLKLFKCDKNLIEVALFYYTLLSKGYLSNEHIYCYSKNCKYFSLLPGINIFIGKGDCKCYSSSFTDLLNILGYGAVNVGVNLGQNKQHQLVNHLATLVTNDNSSVVFDITNFWDIPFYFVDEGKNIYLPIPNYEVISPISLDTSDLFNPFKGVDISNLVKTTSKEEILKLYFSLFNKDIDFFNIGMEIQKINKEYSDVFEKFYQDHKAIYSDIVENRKKLIRKYGKYVFYCRE